MKRTALLLHLSLVADNSSYNTPHCVRLHYSSVHSLMTPQCLPSRCISIRSPILVKSLHWGCNRVTFHVQQQTSDACQCQFQDVRIGSVRNLEESVAMSTCSLGSIFWNGFSCWMCGSEKHQSTTQLGSAAFNCNSLFLLTQVHFVTSGSLLSSFCCCFCFCNLALLSTPFFATCEMPAHVFLLHMTTQSLQHTKSPQIQIGARFP